MIRWLRKALAQSLRETMMRCGDCRYNIGTVVRPCSKHGEIVAVVNALEG